MTGIVNQILKEKPMNQECRNCGYYVHKQNEDAGICYRYPPQPQIVMMPQKNVLTAGMSVTPVPVSIDNIVPKDRKACGEFKIQLKGLM